MGVGAVEECVVVRIGRGDRLAGRVEMGFPSMSHELMRRSPSSFASRSA